MDGIGKLVNQGARGPTVKPPVALKMGRGGPAKLKKKQGIPAGIFGILPGDFPELSSSPDFFGMIFPLPSAKPPQTTKKDYRIRKRAGKLGK